MKHVLYILLIAAAGMWGYNIGTIEPRVVQENPTEGYHEVQCDDITRSPLSHTLVCEVSMRTEDEPIKIFRREQE